MVAIESSSPADSGVRADKDTSADNQEKPKNNSKRGPRNLVGLARFRKALAKGLRRGQSMNEIALEFTDGDETKTQSLLRKHRRHKDLPG